jgi:hypothetical protein
MRAARRQLPLNASSRERRDPYRVIYRFAKAVRRVRTTTQACGYGPGVRRDDQNAYAEIAFADCTSLRSRNFWILPVDVFGIGPNTTAFGVLKPDMWPRQ